MERRVVVTGMGAVSPLGLDVPTLWQGVQEARSGVGPVTLCDTEKLDSKIAGEVKGFDAQNYMDRKEVRRNDRFIHFALAATDEVLRSAELTITPENAEEIGVIIGSGIGGIETFADGMATLRDKGSSRVSPSAKVSMPPIPLPMITPISSAFSGVIVSSADRSASWVAANAKWMNRSFRRTSLRSI